MHSLLFRLRKWIWEGMRIHEDVVCSSDYTIQNFQIIPSRWTPHIHLFHLSLQYLCCNPGELIIGTTEENTHDNDTNKTITFDVGGTEFKVSCEMIEKEEGSMLDSLVLKTWLKDSAKPIFIDHNYNNFEWEFGYLHCGNVTFLTRSIKTCSSMIWNSMASSLTCDMYNSKYWW